MNNPNAPEDGREVVVRDPEDFNRQQRFKEIHEARQRVTEYVAQMEMPGEGGGQFNLQHATRLGYLVSMYIMELEPLIEESGMDTSRFVSDNTPYDDLMDFASKLGVKFDVDYRNEETPAPQESMHFFSAANRFYARVGMDLDVGEERGDAGFDYSDILEEGPPGDGDKPEITADGVADE